MKTRSALIFDVDGTLAETEQCGHRLAFNQAFADNGLDWFWDEKLYRRLLRVTGGVERLHHYAAGQPGDDVGERRLAQVHADKNVHYQALLAAGRIALRPGVAEVLHAARVAGVQLAIATTSSRSNVEMLLRATLGDASPGWFAVIGAADDVVRKKPAADIYRHVLESLRLPAGRCLAIEDSASGLAAARGAGLRCVITRNAESRDDDFSDALQVLDSLDELGFAGLHALLAG